jgi:hypothetical protein
MKKINLFLIAGLVALLAFSAEAQTVPFFNPLSTAGVFPQTDTVTNTATNFITTRRINQERATQTVVQVNVTKISGTVGGTISLLGSTDGVNFYALRTIETVTALPTHTAADATASYHWRLTGAPFPFFRVSYTGTGTMSASFGAQIFFSKAY